MHESYLPWWLILLIGMWAAALTLWQHPAVHREVRLWAGLLTLVYLGLLFLALGKFPADEASAAEAHRQTSVVKVGFAVCVILSMAASVWFVGRATASSRQLSYLVLTLANSAVAFLMQYPEVAAGLFLVAGLSIRPVFHKWWRSSSVAKPEDWIRSFLQFKVEQVPQDKSGVIWLAGCTNGVLACLLLGTIAFSLRFEASRTSPSSRLTALPSRKILERHHEKSAEKIAVLNFVFGSRSEIFVLLAVILFLCLAITSGEESERKSLPIEASNEMESDSMPVSPV